MRNVWKKGIAMLLVMAMCLADVGALAQAVLTLPQGLQSIGDQAFYGDTSIHTVNVPEGVTSIGEKAFGNSSLAEISLPASLQHIADNAFTGVPEGLIVTAPEGSVAYNWAVKHGYILPSGEGITVLSALERLKLYSVINNGEGFERDVELARVRLPEGEHVTRLNMPRLEGLENLQLRYDKQEDGSISIRMGYLYDLQYDVDKILRLYGEDEPLPVRIESDTGWTVIDITLEFAGEMIVDDLGEIFVLPDKITVTEGEDVVIPKVRLQDNYAYLGPVATEVDWDDMSLVGEYHEEEDSFVFSGVEPGEYYTWFFFDVEGTNLSFTESVGITVNRKNPEAEEPLKLYDYYANMLGKSGIYLFSDTVYQVDLCVEANKPVDMVVAQTGRPAKWTLTLEGDDCIKEAVFQGTPLIGYENPLLIGPATATGEAKLTVRVELGGISWQEEITIHADSRASSELDISLDYPEVIYPGDVVIGRVVGKDAWMFDEQADLVSAAFGEEEWGSNVVVKAGVYPLYYRPSIKEEFAGLGHYKNGWNEGDRYAGILRVADADGHVPDMNFDVEEGDLIYSADVDGKAEYSLRGYVKLPEKAETLDFSAEVIQAPDGINVDGGSWEDLYLDVNIYDVIVEDVDDICGAVITVEVECADDVKPGEYDVVIRVKCIYNGKTVYTDVTMKIIVVSELERLQKDLADVPATAARGEQVRMLSESGYHFSYCDIEFENFDYYGRGDVVKIDEDAPLGDAPWTFYVSYPNGLLTVGSGVLTITEGEGVTPPEPEEGDIDFGLRESTNSVLVKNLSTELQVGVFHGYVPYGQVLPELVVECATGQAFELEGGDPDDNSDYYYLSAVEPLVTGKHTYVIKTEDGRELYKGKLLVMGEAPYALTNVPQEVIPVTPAFIPHGSFDARAFFADLQSYAASYGGTLDYSGGYANYGEMELSADLCLYGCRVEVYHDTVLVYDSAEQKAALDSQGYYWEITDDKLFAMSNVSGYSFPVATLSVYTTEEWLYSTEAYLNDVELGVSYDDGEGYPGGMNLAVFDIYARLWDLPSGNATLKVVMPDGEQTYTTTVNLLDNSDYAITAPASVVPTLRESYLVGDPIDVDALTGPFEAWLKQNGYEGEAEVTGTAGYRWNWTTNRGELYQPGVLVVAGYVRIGSWEQTIFNISANVYSTPTEAGQGYWLEVTEEQLFASGNREILLATLSYEVDEEPQEEIQLTLPDGMDVDVRESTESYYGKLIHQCRIYGGQWELAQAGDVTITALCPGLNKTVEIPLTLLDNAKHAIVIPEGAIPELPEYMLIGDKVNEDSFENAFINCIKAYTDDYYFTRSGSANYTGHYLQSGYHIEMLGSGYFCFVGEVTRGNLEEVIYSSYTMVVPSADSYQQGGVIEMTEEPLYTKGSRDIKLAEIEFLCDEGQTGEPVYNAAEELELSFDYDSPSSYSPVGRITIYGGGWDVPAGSYPVSITLPGRTQPMTLTINVQDPPTQLPVVPDYVKVELPAMMKVGETVPYDTYRDAFNDYLDENNLDGRMDYDYSSSISWSSNGHTLKSAGFYCISGYIDVGNMELEVFHTSTTVYKDGAQLMNGCAVYIKDGPLAAQGNSTIVLAEIYCILPESAEGTPVVTADEALELDIYSDKESYYEPWYIFSLEGGNWDVAPGEYAVSIALPGVAEPVVLTLSIVANEVLEKEIIIPEKALPQLPDYLRVGDVIEFSAMRTVFQDAMRDEGMSSSFTYVYSASTRWDNGNLVMTDSGMLHIYADVTFRNMTSRAYSRKMLIGGEDETYREGVMIKTCKETLYAQGSRNTELVRIRYLSDAYNGEEITFTADEELFLQVDTFDYGSYAYYSIDGGYWDVEGGEYDVTIHLPDGKTITHTLTIVDGEPAPMEIPAEYCPNMEDMLTVGYVVDIASIREKLTGYMKSIGADSYVSYGGNAYSWVEDDLVLSKPGRFYISLMAYTGNITRYTEWYFQVIEEDTQLINGCYVQLLDAPLVAQGTNTVTLATITYFADVEEDAQPVITADENLELSDDFVSIQSGNVRNTYTLYGGEWSVEPGTYQVSVQLPGVDEPIELSLEILSNDAVDIPVPEDVLPELPDEAVVGDSLPYDAYADAFEAAMEELGMYGDFRCSSSNIIEWEEDQLIFTDAGWVRLWAEVSYGNLSAIVYDHYIFVMESEAQLGQGYLLTTWEKPLYAQGESNVTLAEIIFMGDEEGAAPVLEADAELNLETDFIRDERIQRFSIYGGRWDMTAGQYPVKVTLPGGKTVTWTLDLKPGSVPDLVIPEAYWPELPAQLLVGDTVDYYAAERKLAEFLDAQGVDWYMSFGGSDYSKEGSIITMEGRGSFHLEVFVHHGQRTQSIGWYTLVGEKESDFVNGCLVDVYDEPLYAEGDETVTLAEIRYIRREKQEGEPVIAADKELGLYHYYYPGDEEDHEYVFFLKGGSWFVDPGSYEVNITLPGVDEELALTFDLLDNKEFKLEIPAEYLPQLPQHALVGEEIPYGADQDRFMAYLESQGLWGEFYLRGDEYTEITKDDTALMVRPGVVGYSAYVKKSNIQYLVYDEYVLVHGSQDEMDKPYVVTDMADAYPTELPEQCLLHILYLDDGERDTDAAIIAADELNLYEYIWASSSIGSDLNCCDMEVETRGWSVEAGDYPVQIYINALETTATFTLHVADE